MLRVMWHASGVVACDQSLRLRFKVYIHSKIDSIFVVYSYIVIMFVYFVAFYTIVTDELPYNIYQVVCSN